jgi:small-conductance mechanosensitive channel
VAALLLHAVLGVILRQLVHRDRSPALHAALESADKPSRITIVPLALLVALPVAALPPKIDDVAGRLLGIALVVGLGWTFVRMIAAAFDVALAQVADGSETTINARRRRTQLALFRRLSILAVIMITVGLVLTAIPAVRNVGLSLFASAGVAGVIVGIAAQPTITNLIAGIQLAVTQPIRIGDAVLVEGEWGHVEAISSTHVVIAIWDERRLVVPLSYFLQRPFQNWTLRSSELVQPVFLYLDYSVPVVELRQKLTEILSGSPLWDRRVSVLQITELKEQNVEIRLLVSAADSGQAWDLRCYVREQMLLFIRENFPDSLPRTRVDLTRSDIEASLDRRNAPEVPERAAGRRAG